MTEPLPPELKDMLAAERAAPTPDAAARAAARARLAAAVGHAPPGATGAIGVGKLLAILAVVVAAGTFAVRHGRDESHARITAPAAASKTPVIAPAPMPPLVGTPSTVPPAPSTPDTSHAEERPAAKDSQDAKKPSPVGTRGALGGTSLRSPTPATPSLPPEATQAELIRQAWSALAVGEPDRALSIVRDDERLHRDGALAEERDAVHIVALARLGRRDEARLAATQFEHDYPTSLHHDLVERALASGPDQDP